MRGSSSRTTQTEFSGGGTMTDGEVRYSRDGEVATVIFDRPAARNAMTWRMYEQLGVAAVAHLSVSHGAST